jgi:hypothetical protein
MEATITVKMTPYEFDVLRTSLEFAAQTVELQARDTETAAETRRELRQQAAERRNLLARLR